jgi:hypothetical protein
LRARIDRTRRLVKPERCVHGGDAMRVDR